jgi:hypothetical protein
MAVNIVESLVRRSVPVMANVMNNSARIGSDQAKRQTPAFLSHLRHPSQRFPWAGYQPGTRGKVADTVGDNCAAERAGRPGSIASVLVRRSLAMGARSAVPFGWPLAAGEFFPMAQRCCDSMRVKRQLPGEEMLPGRPVSTARLVVRDRSARASTGGYAVR